MYLLSISIFFIYLSFIFSSYNFMVSTFPFPFFSLTSNNTFHCFSIWLFFLVSFYDYYQAPSFFSFSFLHLYFNFSLHLLFSHLIYIFFINNTFYYFMLRVLARHTQRGLRNGDEYRRHAHLYRMHPNLPLPASLETFVNMVINAWT